MFRIKCMHQMLTQYFTGVHLDMASPTFTFMYMGEKVKIMAPLMVECSNADVKHKVSNILRRIFLTLYPLPIADEGCCC